MPLLLPENLPAVKLLEEENIFPIANPYVCQQGMKPLRIAILNLMPLKEVTEMNLIRLLSCSPLLIDVVFMKIKSHVCKNTSPEHMEMFYSNFDDLCCEKFDGLIITGAPIEHLDFKDVSYWKDITEIFEWTKTNVTSTMYICWAAQAGLYYHYGIPKYPLSKKMFGIFPQKPSDLTLPLYRGFDDEFCMPHSRHTELRCEDILLTKGISLIAQSDISGVGAVMSNDGRGLFITGHMEYSAEILDYEYNRDRGRRTDVDVPVNYYKDDNPDNPPVATWRAHATLLYGNWINYYVNNKVLRKARDKTV